MIARSFTTGGHFEERTMTVSKNVLMALLILSYATWGGGMIAMKYAFESFTAMQVVFARVAFAGVIYLALYRLWSHIPYQKGDWKYLLAMVLFEPCLFFLCETFATYLRVAENLKSEGVSAVFSGEREVAVAMTEHLMRDFGATDEQIDRERRKLRERMA